MRRHLFTFAAGNVPVLTEADMTTSDRSLAEESNSSTVHVAGRSAREAKSAARVFVLAAAVLVLIGLAPVLVGLAGAVALYEICRGPHTWAARRVNPRFAAVLIICLALLVVVVPLFWLGQHLVAKLPSVIATIQRLETRPD